MKYKLGSLFAALLLIGATAFGQTANVTKSTVTNNLTGTLNTGTQTITANDGGTITYSGTGAINSTTLQGTTPTAAGLSLLDDATAADQRTTLGLGNVDNTSDANKPVSTATQTALDLKANAGRVVYADDFGADPTGATDSSADIQAALDSFAERGGTVILGRGTYRCDSTILLGNTSRLIGQGSGLREQPSTDPTLIYHPATVLDFSNAAIDGIETDPAATYRCQQSVVKGITIRGSGAANGKAGIKLSPGLHAVPKVGLFRVEDCHIEFFQIGIRLLTSDSTTIIETWMTDCANALTEGGSECKVQGGGWWRITGSGWYSSTGGERFWLINAEIEPENASTTVNWTGVSKGVISGNHFRNPATAITLDDCTGITVIGNAVVATSVGVNITGTTTNTVVTGNTFLATTGSVSGVNIALDAPTAQRVTCVGNSASGTFSSAPLVSDESDTIEITGNAFSSYRIGGRTYTDSIAGMGLQKFISSTTAVESLRFGTTSAGRVTSTKVSALLSGAGSDGWGPALTFSAADDAGTLGDIASISAHRNGGDTTFGATLWGTTVGVFYEALRADSGALRTPASLIFLGGMDTAGGAIKITSGNGSPEGVVSANVGSIYFQKDGGVGSTLWTKWTGTGTTGWTSVITSGSLPTSTTPLATYASGTAYSMTTSDAAVDFGTTDPTITFATAGTYLVQGRALLRYNGATYAGNETATLHLQRTNNTPAAIPNATTTATLRVITTITDTVGVMPLPPVIYTATAGDILTVYGSVSATPSVGSVDCTEASVVAVRLY